MPADRLYHFLTYGVNNCKRNIGERASGTAPPKSTAAITSSSNLFDLKPNCDKLGARYCDYGPHIPNANTNTNPSTNPNTDPKPDANSNSNPDLALTLTLSLTLTLTLTLTHWM